MIRLSLFSIPNKILGPLKKVAMPNRNADVTRMTLLSILLGTYYTSNMDGMNVIGIIVNIKPTCKVLMENSASLDAKIGSSYVSVKYESAPHIHANTSLLSANSLQFVTVGS